eukprot:CAMPEP_0180139064 /NCGR_PEP_ID=MMETSP0986-20121125/13306_1 /TAXON_ID=697907 /ORGANISM="non described non described, Strain CCMP2293" /LENGTH=122 /DNA_ID=CAMNT_0022081087 /DNA_START=26 /DNA_END=394 /DNA_ORIENTATION=+
MKIAALAFIGSAAAFSPTMSVSTGRRAAIQGAGAVAIAAPLLRPTEAEAASKYAGAMYANPSAPVLTLLDHRGCSRQGTEYKGPKANDQEDEQVVILRMQKVGPGEAGAARFLSNVIGEFNA